MYQEGYATIQVVQTVTSRKSRFFRDAIPILPKSLAVACCILNIFLPCTGTMVASFSVLFCGYVSHTGAGGRVETFCINLFVSILQASLLIIAAGWIWSIIWGMFFIEIASGKMMKGTSTMTFVQQRHLQPGEVVQTTNRRINY